MHIHTVFFWLKTSCDQNQRNRFAQACAHLANIATVQSCHVATPLPSERAVVDHSFSFCLHLTFASTADHDAYQIDPLHDAFVEQHQNDWERVLVYDSKPIA